MCVFECVCVCVCVCVLFVRTPYEDSVNAVAAVVLENDNNFTLCYSARPVEHITL